MNKKLNLIFAGFEDRIYYCILESKNGTSPRMLYSFILFVLPFVSIIGCYSAIFLKVKKGQKDLLSLLGSNSGSDNIRKNIEETNSHLFRMILIISACFIILIVPKLVIKIIIHAVPSTSELLNVEQIFRVLMDANFILNPFVYFFTNKNYREAFIQILPTKLRKIMIKGPPVDQKICENQTHGVETTSSKNTMTTQF